MNLPVAVGPGTGNNNSSPAAWSSTSIKNSLLSLSSVPVPRTLLGSGLLGLVRGGSGVSLRSPTCSRRPSAVILDRVCFVLSRGMQRNES